MKDLEIFKKLKENDETLKAKETGKALALMYSKVMDLKHKEFSENSQKLKWLKEKYPEKYNELESMWFRLGSVLSNIAHDLNTIDYTRQDREEEMKHNLDFLKNW